ncbi:MAG: hydantoinase/oxoprolinase family protein [Alphaproteobacteria bacterium]|nr:hydantoinase/oxoprolinase family protein [Alphaproteobacteria bacterium]
MADGSIGGRHRCRIGIDVGGTFTDFVLSDPRDGRLVYFKEPSTPSDPSQAVERGIQGLLDRAGAAREDIELIVHGTTLGLNAIIQRRGTRVALVVSTGNRDVLELARSRMPSSYDLYCAKEEPLVPRDAIFEIDARADARGRVTDKPRPAQVAQVAKRIKAGGFKAVAVALINSYLAPGIEDEVAAALAKQLPGVLITRSAEIWPEIREYERSLVATMNAYIHPLLNSYLTTLKRRLAAIGVTAPIYITASNGGTLSLETAADRPVDTILSGPAGGVVAAARLAAVAQRREIITIDMGGTSCDMAVSKAGEPEYTTRTEVGDFPLILPVVNVSAIGAGGGSIVWVDGEGILKVGPESAGADPGPVSYGRGGTRATVTDCYLVAGQLDPDRFLGGRMKLDRAAAEKALLAVADRIGIKGTDRAARAADAALRVATAKMATELYKALAYRGLDPAGFALIPFGGAGPTHCNLLAEEARLPTIIVPPGPGTFCALGAILSDVKRDYVRTVRTRLTADPAVAKLLRRSVEALEADGLAWLKREGAVVDGHEIAYAADMRYAGQAFDLNVPIPKAVREKLTAAALADLLHAEHDRRYGFRDADSAVEIMTLRVRITGKVPPIDLPRVAGGGGAAVPVGKRRVFHADGGIGTWIDAPLYARQALKAGTRFAGPAVVEQEDSTVWVLPGWSAAVDAVGNLHLTKGAGA